MSDKTYNERGQSIFEYFILTIIVVAIALGFIHNNNFVDIKNAANNTFIQAVANIVK